METIISFFKRGWWNIIPILTWLFILLIAYITLPFLHKNECSLKQYYLCDETISWPLIRFILSSLIGAFTLMFVRAEIVKKIVLFSVVYVLFSAVYLSTIEPSGWLSSQQREIFAIALGLFLSTVIVLWTVVHTLILRRKEKKN